MTGGARERTRIVALAGTLCSPRIFDLLAERLGEVAEVDAVSWMTLPGPWDLGSVAQHIADRIDSPALVIGHSTGGAIALRLALDHPGSVSGLLLIGTGPNMNGHGDVDAIIARIQNSWGPDLFESVIGRSFGSATPRSRWQQFLPYAQTVTVDSASQVLTSQRETDFEGRLGEIGCPVAVVHGLQDPTRSSDQARGLAAAIRGATLDLLDCGHSPMFEQPGAVAAITRELVSRVDAR